MNLEQRETNMVAPGTLLREESYRGESNHPEFAAYWQQECEHVKTAEIMKHWTEQPIMSEGFSSCHALVAEKINEHNEPQAQAAHFSYDSYNATDPRDMKNKLGEWQAEQDPVMLVYSDDSAISQPHEMRNLENLQNTLKQQLHPVPLNSKSRFGLVYDTQKHLLLVQLTDEKLLRVYQGF